MSFNVIYDANVLYPNVLRDLLIRVAQAGLVQARWTDEILDETFRSLKLNRPDLDSSRLDRTRRLMCESVRDCLVSDYSALERLFDLPDPDDRHVVAAAVKSHSQIIVTYNLRDFPQSALDIWGLEAKHPDAFLIDQFHLDSLTLHTAVSRIADSTKSPPLDVGDILDRLEDLDLIETASALRR
ncbi:PIN domain-containing protein [Saxibacter everestensis]|uniref:PIN domain-containing protein n=1 Tax=Saxibacter everestensis TaxID=2909229 RepID=UPI003D80A80F